MIKLDLFQGYKKGSTHFSGRTAIKPDRNMNAQEGKKK